MRCYFVWINCLDKGDKDILFFFFYPKDKPSYLLSLYFE